MKQYKISEVSHIASVSIRTLHHYDKIGLICPKSNFDNGYRVFTDQDLERLQQVLFFKELGFSLKEVKDILDSPGFDRILALESQRGLLQQRIHRLNALINTIDKTTESIKGGRKMQKEEMFTAFSMERITEHQRKYAQETKEKYGHTDAYQESQKRAAGYSRQQWESIANRSNQIYQNLAALMDKEPGDSQVQAVIGQWRDLISESFYNCTTEIFRGLGDMYVADQRFTENIDRYGQGLAAFMRDAMHIYCDRQEK